MRTDEPLSPTVDIEPAIVRFEPFEYNLSSGELRRDGTVMPLQAQPTRVLSLLILRAGEIVSRDELHSAIWGHETGIDFEGGLNACIAQIRSVLGDESSSPRFIRTVPRRGYQFIGPVERFSPAEQPPPPAKFRLAKTSGRTLFTILALALAAVAIFAIANWRQIVPGFSSPTIVAVARFDNETGDPGVDKFCRSLTDNVVQQLASDGQDHYAVITNAAELKVPREERDLGRIASTLGANYIVLGQVQGSGAETRIFAQLIHMPDQARVWVVRLEQPFSNPFVLESTAANDIAAEFARRLVPGAH